MIEPGVVVTVVILAIVFGIMVWATAQQGGPNGIYTDPMYLPDPRTYEEENDGTCGSMTQEGTPCQNPASHGDTCWMHDE